MATKGFPELQRHYRLLGAPDNVMLSAHTEFGHNYNYVSRRAMYEWFNTHLRLGLSSPIEERPFQRLTGQQLTVWDDEHPAPKGGEAFEREILQWLERDSQRPLAQLTPADKDAWKRFRALYSAHLAAVIGRQAPRPAELEWNTSIEEDRGAYLEFGGLLTEPARREASPMIYLFPKEWNGTVVVWLSEQGKASLYDEAGLPNSLVAKLVGRGVAVASVDLFQQGEFLEDPSQPLTETRRVQNPREFAGYTWGYNHSLFARRVHDVMRAITFIGNHEYQPKRVVLAALDQTGPIAAASRALLPPAAVHSAAIDTHGFRFAQVNRLSDPAFLPGGAKLGDLPSMLAIAAPGRLWLAGETDGDGQALYAKAYQAAQADSAWRQPKPGADVEAALNWLLQ